MLTLYSSPRVDDARDPATRQIALAALRRQLWHRIRELTQRATRSDRGELRELRRMHRQACALLRELSQFDHSNNQHQQVTP